MNDTSIKPHIGHKIKEIFDSKNVKIIDFAKDLKIARQNVYRIFQKESIDTELLFKISQILGYNFFSFYMPEDKINKDLTPLQRAQIEKLKSEKTILKMEIQLYKKEIDYLKKIIKLLEEKRITPVAKTSLR